jgi:photosystem II stability/assembly factor-like uncharacterized protein
VLSDGIIDGGAQVRTSQIGVWPGGTVLDLAVEHPAFASTAQEEGNVVLAATFAGIYRSTDGGKSWYRVEADLPDWFIQTVALGSMGGQLLAFAASRMGWVYRSTDGGETWTTISDWRDTGIVTRLVVSPGFATDGIVFACTEEDGLFKSSDRGRTWKAASFGLLNLSVTSFGYSPDFAEDEIAFAGTEGGGLFRTRNGGRAWRESGEGLPNSAVQCVAVSPNFTADGIVLVGTEDRGLYRSDDGGRTWRAVIDASDARFLSREACVNSISIAPDGKIALATDEGLLVSEDGGHTWRDSQSGPDYPYVVVAAQEGFLSGAYDQGVYRSRDGEAWQPSNQGLVAHLPPMTCFSDDFEHDRCMVMASMEGTIVRSEDGGQEWMMAPQEVGEETAGSPGDIWGTVSALASTGQGSNMTLLASADADLAWSEDGGLTWQIAQNVAESPIMAVAFSQTFEQDKMMLAGTAGGQVLVSCDGGESWIEQAVLDGQMVVALAAREGGDQQPVLYAVGAVQQESGLWKLALYGGSPLQEILSRETSQPAAVLGLESDRLFCALEQRMLCISGEQVSESEFEESASISSLAVSSELALAGTRSGVFGSVDGESWNRVSDETAVVAVHVASSSRAYAVSMGGHVWEFDLSS